MYNSKRKKKTTKNKEMIYFSNPRNLTSLAVYINRLASSESNPQPSKLFKKKKKRKEKVRL